MEAITKESNIANVVEEHPEVASLLMNANMHCLGCMMAHNETLEQACAVHGIDADAMVGEINQFLGNK